MLAGLLFWTAVEQRIEGTMTILYAVAALYIGNLTLMNNVKAYQDIEIQLSVLFYYIDSNINYVHCCSCVQQHPDAGLRDGLRLVHPGEPLASNIYEVSVVYAVMNYICCHEVCSILMYSTQTMFLVLTGAVAVHQFVARILEKAPRRPLRFLVSR